MSTDKEPAGILGLIGELLMPIGVAVLAFAVLSLMDTVREHEKRIYQLEHKEAKP